MLVSVGDKIRDKDELEDLILFDMGIDGLDPSVFVMWRRCHTRTMMRRHMPDQRQQRGAPQFYETVQLRDGRCV